MNQLRVRILLYLCLYASTSVGLVAGADAQYGAFDKLIDVGVVERPGSVQFIESGRRYQFTAGGANIWGAEDGFSCLFKETSKDLDLQAGVTWKGAGVNAHRKAGWMVRSDLSPGAPYNDHGLSPDGTIMAISHHDQDGVSHTLGGDRARSMFRLGRPRPRSLPLYVIDLCGLQPSRMLNKERITEAGRGKGGLTPHYAKQLLSYLRCFSKNGFGPADALRRRVDGEQRTPQGVVQYPGE